MKELPESFDTVAQELAMHVSLCVCAEYIESWGLADFLEKLQDYSADPALPFVFNYADKMEREP
jgi:hypothetical protein